MKLYETNLPNNYCTGLLNEKDMILGTEHTDKIADILFTSAALSLNGNKDKNQPVALRFDRNDGSMVAAAVVQFFENTDDKDQPGNWNLVFTFDESDIPDNTKVFNISNPMIQVFFRATAGDKYRIVYKTPQDIIELNTYFFEMLHKWLDENAKEGEVVSVEAEGIFEARVAIEGGEKVFSIEPAGEIKMLIKDDASIEK